MSITATIDFGAARYDRDADVLYLSVGDSARAVDFDETPEGHALRYDADGDLVGITIVGARKLVDEHRDTCKRRSRCRPTQSRRSSAEAIGDSG
jgi:uncharacterized protein YuzE